MRLLDAHGKPISEVVVGKSRPNAFGTGRGGVYVRRPSETQTWLAAAEPNMSIDVKEWVDVAIYKADVTKLQRVTVEHANEVPIVVEKGSAPNAKFALKSVPEGVKVKQNAPRRADRARFRLHRFRRCPQARYDPDRRNREHHHDGKHGWLDGHLPPAPRGHAGGGVAVVHGGGHRRRQEGRRRDQCQVSGWEFKIPDWKANQIGKRAAELFETS